MPQMSTAMPWLVRCGVTAALVLLACRIATPWIDAGLQQPAVTARDGSLITFNRYVREPKPVIALVGSSVSWRLKEEYFSQAGVRNLALAGGSPVTGLAIIAEQRELPKIVLIETNVLSREPDAALIDRFSSGKAGPALLQPVRMAVAAYELWNHAPPDAAQAAAAREQLLRQPPSDFDNRVYVERAVQQMNADDPTAAARANVDKIRKLIADIEQRGSHALLFEVPFQPETEKTRAANITRQTVAAAFPDRNRWLHIEPVRSELRWADGVHLDERSAQLVTRSIEQALATRSTH